MLLDRNRNIKITDFGFANQFRGPGDDLMSTSCGSPCYAAPELVVSDGLYVGTAVDIWSCGVILYAMLAGYLPFDDDPANPDGDNIKMLYNYILSTKLEFPSHVSQLARDLLSRMLVPNPRKRATMGEIKEHQWLAPYASIFAPPIISHGTTAAAQDKHDLPGTTADGSEAANGSASPEAADTQAKKSKRHTIQVEYSNVSSRIDDEEMPLPGIPTAGKPSEEIVSQARAAAQAALMGERREERSDNVGADSAMELIKARAKTYVSDCDDQVVPSAAITTDNNAASNVGGGSQSKGSAGRNGSSSRPRPLSMFASTDRRADEPDEPGLPPPIAAIMNMEQEQMSSASSIDGNAGPYSAGSYKTSGSSVRNQQQLDASDSQHGSGRSRSNSERRRRVSIRSNHGNAFSAFSFPRDGTNYKRGRVPEIPPVIPVNSKNGEELGIGVGAGIASQMPRKVEDVLYPDSPTRQQPSQPQQGMPSRVQSTGPASRVKSWFNKRTSRWGVPGISGNDHPFTISSVLATDRQDQPEILQHMRVHRGVIDPDALSELPPDVLFSHVLQTLDELGFTILKTEGLKIRVLRPQRQLSPASGSTATPEGGRSRTISTSAGNHNTNDDNQDFDGPRRQSVPVVLSKSPDAQESSAARRNKRATIMNPSQYESEIGRGFSLSEKSVYRRQRTALGTTLTSMKRFFGGNGRRWFNLSSISEKNNGDGNDKESTTTHETERGGADHGKFGFVRRPRRGSSATGSPSPSSRGLGILVSSKDSPSPDSPHRRSLSESPYINAKALRDQVNGGLEAVPEEGEAQDIKKGSEEPSHPISSQYSQTAAASVGSENKIDLSSPFTDPFKQQKTAPPYGSSNVDNGEEVQLAIEVCKIKNLSNFFIVHLSRRKGNVWAYKELYHLIMAKLALRSDERSRYASPVDIQVPPATAVGA